MLKQIVDPKAQFRSVAEPGADSSTSTGHLMLAGIDADGGATLSALAPPKAAAAHRIRGQDMG
jgi:hypothetical protein